MKVKKPYFSCNCNGKIHLAIFVFPLSYVLICFLHDKMFLFSKPINTFKILKYNLPYLFYLYLPKIFSIIIILIIKSNIKNENGLELNNNRTTITKNYHIVTINRYGKKMILYLCIVSLLEVLYDNIDCLAYYYQMKGELHWLVEKKTGYILFVPIFSYVILDKQLYKHHSLALF